jgi:hypothetical protein
MRERQPAALVFSSALCVACMVAAEPASAYVRTVTTTGVPVWWRNPCITMDFLLGSPPPDMTGDAYLQAARAAAAAWGHPTLACSGLVISIRKTAETSAAVGYDGRNVIVLSQDTWCSERLLQIRVRPLAIRPTRSRLPPCSGTSSTGEIVDADMEVNAVNVFWADLVQNPSLATGSTADFQNMLTHELGHVIGLAHSCYIASDGPTRLTDNQGQPELDCASPDLPATVADATMFPSVSMSDTSRRELTPDDAQGACDIYPSSVTMCPSGRFNGARPGPAPRRAPRSNRRGARGRRTGGPDPASGRRRAAAVR